MFKHFKNTFGRDSKEKRERSSSAFDPENFPNPLSSNSAHLNLLQHGDEGVHLASCFNNRVQQAGLHQMAFELEVWKTGVVTENDTNLLKAPASRFLESGRDSDKVHNYSFESFLITFEEKLNIADGGNPIHIMFGKLGFLDHKGIYEAVVDQDSFGVALNNLYLNRGNNNVLTFVFQPESDQHRKKRLEIKGGHNDAQLKETDDEADRGRTFPGETPSKILQQERLSPFTTVDSEQRSEDIRRLRTDLPVQVSAMTGLPNHRISPHTEHLSGFRRESGYTVATTPPSPRSTNSSKQSHIGSIRAAVKKAVKAPVKRIPETKDEERERFKFLYQEEKRVTFKRGGDEGVDDGDVDKLEILDDGTAEGEVEEQLEEKQEDDDDEEEISNEDRIVSKYVLS
jgi:hypothetical protein